MKKIIFGLAVVSILFAASCKKSTYAGGSWAYLGNVYNVTNCESIGNRLVATNSSNTNVTIFGNLAIIFPGASVPTASGSYTIVDTIPVGNQVNVSVAIGGVYDTAYNAPGGIGTNQTVAVKVSNGVMTASATNINVLNALGTVDSGALSFNIYTAGKN
jgi:hypothetical protein